MGRPTKTAPKEAVKLRLDPDVPAVLRATGAGWQTRVNTILQERFALQRATPVESPPSQGALQRAHTARQAWDVPCSSNDARLPHFPSPR